MNQAERTIDVLGVENVKGVACQGTESGIGGVCVCAKCSCPVGCQVIDDYVEDATLTLSLMLQATTKRATKPASHRRERREGVQQWWPPLHQRWPGR
jgi:hypothetical protein